LTKNLFFLIIKERLKGKIMIEVPIDKIITLENFMGNMNQFVDTAKNENTIFVITKSGKPYAAIVGIDYLEHLPEIHNGSETQKIHEIGIDNSTNLNKVEEVEKTIEKQVNNKYAPEVSNEQIDTNQAPSQPNNTNDVQESQNPQQPQSNNIPNPANPTEEIYDESVGPWKNDKKQGDNQPNDEPPDLPI